MAWSPLDNEGIVVVVGFAGQGLAAPLQAPPAGQGYVVPVQPQPQASTGFAGYTRQYTVQRGDTLGAIARAYGVTIADLAAVNGIADPNFIYPGQVLVVP